MWLMFALMSKLYSRRASILSRKANAADTHATSLLNQVSIGYEEVQKCKDEKRKMLLMGAAIRAHEKSESAVDLYDQRSAKADRVGQRSAKIDRIKVALSPWYAVAAEVKVALLLIVLYAPDWVPLWAKNVAAALHRTIEGWAGTAAG